MKKAPTNGLPTGVNKEIKKGRKKKSGRGEVGDPPATAIKGRKGD